MTADTPQAEAWPEVKEVQMVSYATGFREPAPPEWRIEIGGICADFSTKGAADNFAAAVAAEITAREAVARAEGWAVAWDAAAAWCRVDRRNDLQKEVGYKPPWHKALLMAGDDIERILTPPPDIQATLATRDAALVEAAVLAEREACAALALEMSWTDLAGVKTQSSKAIAIAAAIRARSGQ